MNIPKSTVLILNLLFSLTLHAQEEYFLDMENSLHFMGVEKDNNGDYIASYLADSLDYHYWSGLVKFDNDFNHEIFTHKIDSLDIVIWNLVVTDDNNYLLAGTIGIDDGIGIYNHTVYFLLVDDNFNVLSEEFFELPPEYTQINVKIFKNDDGRIYVMIVNQDPTMLGFIELSQSSEIKKEIIYYGVTGWPMNPFPKPDGNGFYLLRNSTSPQHIGEITEVDTSFNLTSHLLPAKIDDIWYDMGSRGSCKWLSDSTYILVSEGSKESETRDLYIYKMNAQHEFLTEPFIIGQGTVKDNSLTSRGVDWVDPGHIYVASWYWPSMSYTIPYYVAVFNQDFEVLGTKNIGGGQNNYFVRSLLATDNGGCILVGGQRDIEGGDEYDWNGYAAFFSPEDIITSATETKNSFDSDYLLYPNPGNNQLTIQSARKGVILKLYNLSGQLLKEQKLSGEFRNHIDTQTLEPGIYQCLLSDKKGNVEHKKWIKY